MEAQHIPLHLIREVRRGVKHNCGWASFIVRTKAGGQATVVFWGSVPGPNATGDYLAVRAQCKRTNSGDWFIFSEAVVSQQAALKSNAAATPERRASMAIEAARKALQIALEQLERGGGLAAADAALYASHACDSLHGYLDLHGIGDTAPQQFEDDDDDDFDVVSFADWHQPDEAAA